MDFSKTLFRCSSLGYIMTEEKGGGITEKQLQTIAELTAKEKLTEKQSATLADLIAKRDAPPGLSATAKTHMIDVYVSTKYSRNTDITNKYLEKGLMVEEDSITLFSRIEKQFFRKNEDHLSNDFIKGTPDLYEGESILKATHIIDIKSSWDIYTFFRTFTKDVNKDYYWQLQGYMALTGAKYATLAYCLVNTPEVLINDEKRRLLYKMGVATEENMDYIEACEEIDRLSRYDDIPMEQRMLKYRIERNDADISVLYDRVKVCREFLAELDAKIDCTQVREIPHAA